MDMLNIDSIHMIEFPLLWDLQGGTSHCIPVLEDSLNSPNVLRDTQKCTTEYDFI